MTKLDRAAKLDGWKCTAGYIMNSPVNGDDINSFPVMDKGVFANFPELYNVPSIREKDPILFYNMVKEVTPAVDYFFTKLSYLYQNSSDALESLRASIPSIRTGFPNIYLYFLNNLPTGGYIFLNIPSLKKFVSYPIGNSVPYRPSIFDIVDNKIVNGIEYPINNPGYLDIVGASSGQATAVILAYNGDYSRESLSNDDNTNFVVIGYANNSYRFLNNGTNKNSAFLVRLFSNYSPPDVDTPDNPYEPGGDSGEGGGDGTFDDSSDQIVDSTPPTISSANTGFTRIYNPTLSQVQALAEYLWTGESVVQTIWNHIKQYFENPMEAMIGFNLVPVSVPNGGTTTFKLMYIDTGVSMTAAASQFVDTDCGTLKLEPYYGSALDYSPYTKVSIFLPYIGMVSVDTDEVMGRTIQVKYRTDICSGACVAKILVDGNVLYQYTGHCAINIPFSAADFSSYVSAVMSTAKLAGTLALGASGALGPVAVSEITQQTGESITKTVNTERNPYTGRQVTLSSNTQTKGPSEITTTKASYAGISPSNVTNTVGEVISSKPHVEHSGSFSGTSGYLGIRRPYVIIKRPNMCMPANYQSLNGFPCMITLKLGDCKGFTRVQQVVLSKMGKATNPEQAEILGLLKNGVIL